MIGIGVIGIGERMVNVLKELLACSDSMKIVSIFDPGKKSVEFAKAELPLGQAEFCDDYQQVLKNPDVSWVMIGSWNCFHAEQTIAAFRAGKNVFCEKPLATTLEDCLAMRKAWQESGLQFAIGFTLRYSPHYRKVKEILDAGDIGKIISMEFNETLPFNHGGYIHQNWRRKTEWAGTHLLEKCCHDLDLVNWFVQSLAMRVAGFGGTNFFIPENEYHVDRIGPSKDGKKAFMSWPTVDGNPFTAEKDIVDNQVAIIEYANGVRATFHTNCQAAMYERRMYMVGTEGTLRGDIMDGKIEVQRVGWDCPKIVYDTTSQGGHGGSDPVLARELSQFMLEGVTPKAGIDEGLKSAMTAFAIDEATRKGTVVDLREMWRQAGIQV